jgi:RNA polymerase sigma factor (sigma-70 family)
VWLESMKGRFPSTSWSLVLAAGRSEVEGSEEALATLCRVYWYPLYAYARRCGFGPEEARDLTQGYYAKLLEKHYLRDARRERGRFRSFLLASFRHYVSNARDRERALRRGGGIAILPIEMETAEGLYALEPQDDSTPERIFEKRWARTVLERALSRVRSEFDAAGKAAHFQSMKVFLSGEDAPGSYAERAARLGMTEGAYKVAVHRLRKSFQKALQGEIADTLERPEDVEKEIRFLFQVLA